LKFLNLDLLIVEVGLSVGYIISAKSKQAAAASTKVKASQKSKVTLIFAPSIIKRLEGTPIPMNSAECEPFTLGFGCLGIGEENFQ
jgi:hypothetical protein